MRVLFDHNLFYQIYGGASKYFVMMIRSLPKECSWRTSTLFSRNEHVCQKQLFWRCTQRQYSDKFWRKVIDYNFRWTRRVIAGQHYDVFHQTDYGTYFLKELGSKPLVVTYHDCNFSTYDPHPELVELQRQSITRANAIITPSANTKRDLLEHFDVPSERVHVIHHGIELSSSPLPCSRVVESEYILYVGMRHNHKNFTRMLNAFAKFHHEFPAVKLFCTHLPFSPAEQELIHSLQLDDVVEQRTVSDLELHQLYRDAAFFIYPSLYEGFGMPILEAWAQKCPVLLSNASCFPEVAGDAGYYFEPMDVDDIAAKMITAYSDAALRQALSAKGWARVQDFSWQTCAAKHYEVYRSLV